jgi:2-polyprenyl-6-methoxyphenol hydroxylase-like FAD-dependent oxidoreductase
MTPLPARVTCCIAGGGPAGIMLGFLLARAGVEVLVLEKHGDFLRDFRGDTIHPSTLQLMDELGLLAAFLRRPHQEIRELHGIIGDTDVTIADFSHLPTRCKFVAMIPQWDFLDFLSEAGRQYPSFHLEMETEATGLLIEGDRVVGLVARTAAGEQEIRADLVIGADGRHSVVRERAGLEATDIGAPIDVLWMRLSKKDGDPGQTAGRLVSGRLLVMLDRGDYWQCAYVIRKGGYDAMRARGIENFRHELVGIAPFLQDRVAELQDWDDIKLLTVAVDRLKEWWRPGLLCIGDAAHAMSPIGGVGINLAVQDAVAAANILADPLRDGKLTVEHLQAVQRRRTLPMRVIQRVQVIIQTRILDRVIGSDKPVTAPFAVRLFNWIPWLRRIPARLVGMGIRPEHIRTPNRTAVRPVQQT